jgi:hypothetical protein
MRGAFHAIHITVHFTAMVTVYNVSQAGSSARSTQRLTVYSTLEVLGRL